MTTQSYQWTVDTYDGLRLDRFLAERLPDVSRAYLQEFISKGLVKVEGRVVRKGQTLRKGQNVELINFLHPDDRRIQPNPEVSIPVLDERESYLVLDKPAGLPTHPNDFEDLHTVANAMLAVFPEILDVGDERLRPGVVHRLDTDTSGLLLFARTQKAFAAFRKQFDAREIHKTYLALALGDVKKAREITTPIGHDARNPRKMVAVVPGGKAARSRVREAYTEVEPIESLGSYTLLRVKTRTGRMHQVRVHLSSIGHPIAGDRLYQSGAKRNRDGTALERHFLHAHQIDFRCPEDGEKREFSSALPPDLAAIVNTLR